MLTFHSGKHKATKSQNADLLHRRKSKLCDKKVMELEQKYVPQILVHDRLLVMQWTVALPLQQDLTGWYHAVVLYVLCPLYFNAPLVTSNWNNVSTLNFV